MPIFFSYAMCLESPAGGGLITDPALSTPSSSLKDANFFFHMPCVWNLQLPGAAPFQTPPLRTPTIDGSSPRDAGTTPT